MMASMFILLIYTLSSEDPANPYSVETISSLLDQNLTTSNLAAADVTKAPCSQNHLVPAGKIGAAPAPQDQVHTLTLQLQGRLRSVEEFQN